MNFRRFVLLLTNLYILFIFYIFSFFEYYFKISKKVFEVVTPYHPEDENDGIELIENEIVEEVSNDENDEDCILIKKLSNGEIGYAAYECLKDITTEYREK